MVDAGVAAASDALTRGAGLDLEAPVAAFADSNGGSSGGGGDGKEYEHGYSREGEDSHPGGIRSLVYGRDWRGTQRVARRGRHTISCYGIDLVFECPLRLATTKNGPIWPPLIRYEWSSGWNL